MRDNKRGTIEDPRVDALLRPLAPTPADPFKVLERFFIAVADARSLTDVNIAAGVAKQELRGA